MIKRKPTLDAVHPSEYLAETRVGQEELMRSFNGYLDCFDESSDSDDDCILPKPKGEASPVMTEGSEMS